MTQKRIIANTTGRVGYGWIIQVYRTKRYTERFRVKGRPRTN